MATFPPPRAEIRPQVWLDARLALWMADCRMLVLADIHWGYSTSHRARGNLLPIWGDDEIARRIESLIADYRPEEMVWLGDSIHTLDARAAAEAFLDRCAVPTTVLSGNHDRKWSRAPEATLRRRGYFFHHGNIPSPPDSSTLEIIGHFHPAVEWRDGAGGRLKLPALVASPERLILPAFSPWAAGAPWNRRLLPGDHLWAVAPSRVFAVKTSPRPPSALSA